MSYRLKPINDRGNAKHRAPSVGTEPTIQTVSAMPSPSQPGNVMIVLYAFNDDDTPDVCEQFITHLSPRAARMLAKDLVEAIAKLDKKQRDAA